MHRKINRGTVLVKRTHLKKYYKKRPNKPLYEKLKNNNNHLAQALSQEKQNCQSLFSQNIALIGEVQELRLACNSRDNVILNVLSDAKEILKMLVTMSGYITNTISSCQEFISSNTNLRLSSASAGRKELSRSSIKSPAKGVVKPMVSGHTITKPIINLSRVNMPSIHNSSRLSNIEEVSIPNRDQELNEVESPVAVSIPVNQFRYENGHTCRMPERLMVPSPRVDTDNDRRLRRKRSIHSKRISKSYSRSRSDRWSAITTENNSRCSDQLGSPRVKLNDVSKLLRNSQSINIRTLIDNRLDVNIKIQENGNTSHDTSGRNLITPERQISVNSDEEDESFTPKKDSNAQTSKPISDNRHFDKSLNTIENPRLSQNNTTDWEDPLEGPSWLFNDIVTVSRDDEAKANHINVLDINKRKSKNELKITTYNDVSNHIENIQELLSLSNLSTGVNDIRTPERNTHVADIGNDSSPDEDAAADNSFCTVLPITISRRERNLNNAGNDNKMNFSRFVTLRRGHSKVVDNETEDFTLMLSGRPRNNMHFDINELQLPVLEPIINPIVTDDNDSEQTTTIRRITNIPIPSMSNYSMNESAVDQTTIKLPFILLNDNDRISTPEDSKHSNQKNKKAKILNTKNETDDVKNIPVVKRKAKRKIKLESNRDPSTAKVILEKLNESHIKLRTPSPNNMVFWNTDSHERDSMSNHEENIQNSESNANENSFAIRPRRRKAPVSLKEPSLNTKLRRNV